MSSIKVKIRRSSVPDCEGSIYYQIIHEKKVRQLHTDYKIFNSEWDENRSRIIVDPENERRLQLVSIREFIQYDIERLSKIVSRFDRSGVPYIADDIIEEFKRYNSEYTLFRFMEGLIAGLKSNGRIRTSETYRSALNSFKRFLRETGMQYNFCKDDDIMLDRITSDIMEAYEAWHIKRGVTPNTISFYTRILRAVYNRAVDKGIIENRNPFRHVYTGIAKTVKRALPLIAIRRIKKLDLSLGGMLDYARDMFLMSFYLRGMSFIDMAYLKKSDLRNGYIYYRRRKTGQQLVIEWTNEMQMILDKYPQNQSDYLLPVIRKSDLKERYVYRNACYNINRNLKTIARMVGVSAPLTLYVARHSWASVARSKGIPVGVISEGMGHGSETTTKIYLASLDTSVVDKANALIISSI